MKEIHLLSPERYGYDFIPPEYLPPGKDEYWLRNEQAGKGRPWRSLTPQELEILIKNENHCSHWDNVLVSDPFDPTLIRNSAFYGLIRLGAVRDVLLKHHDFCVPAGIRNSRIISCDIGDDAAIQDCTHISHYLIGDCCILSRIDEMQCTNHAKFGNGVIKDGEDEDVRVWIDVMNEAGGRSILPFEDLIPADAFLWAAWRDDAALCDRLRDITQRQYGGCRGRYGVIGSGTVIKSCKIIKDTAVGSGAYIKGANKLKNVTILSSEEESTQIGEGTEMVNGIVGPGCHAFYGVKAVRFVMGRNSNLKYGARLIHSVLGDNSTISCCEVLNSLIFPVHEQHHNSSFLIAGLLQGMSNIAAGATIGSNHNSRANDGEMRAGRGFWPGLSVTLKHSSCFASFTLIAKGNYPYEMNISLPFSLVNNNVSANRLEVMPAYFWLYNLYALERNAWKGLARDRRKIKKQRIEMDYLAPDTAEEIFQALSLLEGWMKAADYPLPAGSLQAAGDGEDPEYDVPGDDALPATGLERHHRPQVILKAGKAWAAYRIMLRYYAVKTIACYLLDHPETDMKTLTGAPPLPESNSWVNLGGQIAPAFRVDDLRRKIREGEITDWEGIHRAYEEMASSYPLDKALHALGAYCKLTGCAGGDAHPFNDPALFREELQFLIKTNSWIAEQVYASRAKDFDDPYRSITYRNREEMERVVGNARDNAFVRLAAERAEKFNAALAGLSLTGGASTHLHQIPGGEPLTGEA